MLLQQKGAAKAAPAKEEKKPAPFKRQTMHVGIVHYINQARKNEVREAYIPNASISDNKGIQNWKERLEFPYGLGYGQMVDMMNAQRMLRSMQEMNTKELYDKGFHQQQHIM
eukprot:TRINITY_DN71971_c0_g1_i1.p5 TRINITY_DN71971_c0_g1~~TRINITY_DN71971_c0_g1_i1.p5  ORF type:complete len:112 (+),score=16.21 TRINITY_DN71971_c0_g1_i1:1088-1423(+)